MYLHLFTTIDTLYLVNDIIKYLIDRLRIWPGEQMDRCLLKTICALTNRIYCRSLYIITVQKKAIVIWLWYEFLLRSGRSILYLCSNKISSLIQEESGIALQSPQSRRQDEPVHGGNYKGHSLCCFSTHC